LKVSQLCTNIFTRHPRRVRLYKPSPPARAKSLQPTFVGFAMIAPGLQPAGFSRIWDASLCLVLALTLTLTGCSGKSKPQKSPQDNSTPEKESGLTVFDGSLEQFDDTGRPIWKINAKRAKYNKEQKLGKLESPDGELYQDGKLVYKVTSDFADIEDDGKQLQLKGRIVATDPNNGIVLQGNELEWRPKEDLLIVRNQLNGTHKQLQAVAKEARVKTREQKVDFFGGVAAKSAEEPSLQMQTEHLTWQLKDEKLICDRVVQFQRYKNNQITDRGKGDAAEVFLKTKIINITKNAQIELAEPQIQIISNLMTWNLNTEIVLTKSPVRVFHRTENVLVTGNQGELRIPQKTVYLTGSVNAIGKNRQSLKSDKLTWYLNNQLVEANGNVSYQQFNPPLTFAGQTATGNLQQENLVVKGGSNGNKRVLTEIIPQEAKTR
jgi:LPS export ABC transporter protein LptC